MELALFVLVSLGLIIVPGPNVIVIITTSVVHGRSRGMQTVAGTSAAMIIQLMVAALGTAWFVTAISEGLRWLKWLGVAYLLYLSGILRRLCNAWRRRHPLPWAHLTEGSGCP